MKILIALMCVVSLWGGSGVITINGIDYANLNFNHRDKQIFDSDTEGSRVWNWENAKKYCSSLYYFHGGGWQVASRAELLAIMAHRRQVSSNLYIKPSFKMPRAGGRYNDVWFWSRNSNGNLGAFVNFKKHTSGWADKKYKGYVLCTRMARKHTSNKHCRGDAKQENSHSKNWLKAWSVCGGYHLALKRDGTLWSFGSINNCDFGAIAPLTARKVKIHYLKGTKIGSGFKYAKFSIGVDRMYAIKGGELWGWGYNISKRPKRLDHSKNWVSFGTKYSGNGCGDYDVGLKKDGTLWALPEGFSTGTKPKRISRFKDWRKVVLGCANIYGLRKNGTMWYAKGYSKFEFKPYRYKKTYSKELNRLLKNKMARVGNMRVVSSESLYSRVKVNRDGTLCFKPQIKYR